MPICPICGDELTRDSLIHSYNEGTLCFQRWRGTCCNCEKHYWWTERYELYNYFDLEELE